MRMAIVFVVILTLIPLAHVCYVSNCASCPSSLSICIACDAGYYLKSSSECGCTLPCNTCSSTNPTTCITCVDSAHQSPPTCACTSLTMETGWDYHCRQCHHGCAVCSTFFVCSSCNYWYYLSGTSCPDCIGPCESCVNSGTNCLTCWDPTNQLPAPSCQCKDNYHYLDWRYCPLCVSPCLTCTTRWDCLSCVSTAYLLQGTSCPACTLPCATCSGTLTTCTSCHDPSNQATPSCACTSNYRYLNTSTYNCDLCISPCLTCSSSSACLSCVSTSYYLSGTSCPTCNSPCATCSSSSACLSCVSTLYYLVGTTCTLCTRPCVNCSTSLTTCTTCQDTANQAPPTCGCVSTTRYLNPSTKNCDLCISPCLTCSSSTACLSCVSTLYHLVGTTCVLCTKPCVNCLTSLTDCSTCLDASHQVTPTCECSPQTRYMNLSTKYCDSCVSPCYTCTTAAICLSCVSTLYHLVGTTCVLCTKPCVNCLTSLTDCITCLDAPNQVAPTCECSPKTRYMNLTTNYCIPCVSPCYTCSTAVDCLSCSIPHRILVNSRCVCEDGYIASGNDCVSCAYPCASCEGSLVQCTSCVEPFYYKNNQCLQCESQCKSCINKSDYCLECSDLNHSFYQNDCFCSPGYYTGLSQTCEECQSPCQTCVINYDHCTSCNSQLLDIIKNKCICIDGYYHTAIDHCEKCYPECSKCKTLEICTECIDGHYLKNNKCPKCGSKCATCVTQYNHCLTCVDGYLMDDSGECKECISYCKTCLDTRTCEVCFDGAYKEDTYCVPCLDSCKTCVTQNEHCLTCKQHAQLIDNSCYCIKGYYELNYSCIKCVYPCIECTNQDICLTCDSISNLQMSQENKCVCEDGYYWVNTGCYKCHHLCLTCVTTGSNCISCDKSLFRVLNDYQCKCQDKYYEDEYYTCQSCTSNDAKVIKKCYYKDSTDGIWTYGEECDDGNGVNRDGCTNLKLDPGYTCVSVILQASICIKCPDNCQQCKIEEDSSVYCDTCMSGYFSDQLKCIQCSIKCGNCVDNVSNCTACRFIQNPTTKECELCEYQVGYYSNFKTYACYTICGDAITADIEECDDGNSIDGDGCSSKCKNETDYICENNVCIHFPLPVPKIIEYGSVSKYVNKRQVQFTYDQKLNITKEFILSDIIKISVQGSNSTTFEPPYDIDQDFNFDEDSLSNFSAIISVNLQVSGEYQEFVIEFIDTSQIVSFKGQTQNVTQIKTPITDYYYISYETRQAVEIVNSQNQKALILFAVLVIVALLFGGIDIYYNLLDTLQLLSYLIYLNIDRPCNLENFFQLFSVVQLSSYAQNEKVQEVMHKLIIWSELWDISNEMTASEYSSLFIINSAIIILCWMILIAAYWVAKFFIKIINVNRPLLSTYIGMPDIFARMRIYYVTTKIWFFEMCFNAVKEVFYSGIIRSLISTSFDISFAIIIQFVSYSSQQNAALVKVSYYLAIFSCIMYFVCVYLTLFIVDLPKYVQKMKATEQRYGAVFQGIKRKKFSKYFNSFLLVKKFFFMVLLIMCYQCALFQVISITLMQITQSFCMLYFKPLTESQEQFKQSVSEISQSVNLILLSILAIDTEVRYFSYDWRLNIGWLCITFISLMLITQLICDFLQQFSRYMKKYRLLKNFLKKLEKKIKGEREISHVNPFLFEQMTLQIV